MESDGLLGADPAVDVRQHSQHLFIARAFGLEPPRQLIHLGCRLGSTLGQEEEQMLPHRLQLLLLFVACGRPRLQSIKAPMSLQMGGINDENAPVTLDRSLPILLPLGQLSRFEKALDSFAGVA